MIRIINVAEIVIAIALTISILLQNRGADLSQTFGGDFGGYYTRRGFEKFLVYFSVVFSVLFIILAIMNLILARSSI
jgi:protein translocase SecG subunit